MALPLSYNLRSVMVRWKVTVLAIGGIALAVAVLVVLMAMASGFRTALGATGSTENGIVVQRGSGSGADLILQPRAPQSGRVGSPHRQGKDGLLTSPEIVIVASLKRLTDGEPTNITVRGVTRAPSRCAPASPSRQGRNFTSGLNEIIVGGAHRRGASSRLELGRR
jgi:putative ABC transport system permease protein